MKHDNWDVQQRNDGTILVRVPSSGLPDRPLPDAVFTFRPGDPQYDYWHEEGLRRGRPARQSEEPVARNGGAPQREKGL